MRITQGCTRHVILIGDKAIKISRTGIIVIIRQMVHAIMDPDWFRLKQVEHDAQTGRGLLRRICEIAVSGIRANQQEYRLYTNHPELPIAPVYGLYLWGCVLVMARGDPVSSRSSARLRKRFKAYGDLAEPRHVCRINNRLVIIDYGHPLAHEAFGV